MRRSTLKTLRFVRSWLAGGSGADEWEVELDAEGARIPATVFSPVGASRDHHGGAGRGIRGSRSSAVALHGVTRPGRNHADLTRFCRALAASGSVTVVPEIREWVDLRLAPHCVVPVVRAAVDWLEASGPTTGPPGLIGFSFGGPQALRSAADSSLRDRIGAVVAFGSYLDVERTVRFQLLGEHEWEGRTLRLDPDPYGRWIMAANHLVHIPGFADSHDVAHSLHRLAAEAGDLGIPAGSPKLDPLKQELRDRLDADSRATFDLFAPGGASPSSERRKQLERMAGDLSGAALRYSPELSVESSLSGVRCPVHLVHGRSDRLIPFTETLRLAGAFPPSADVRVSITGLFAHTRGSPMSSRIATVREGWRFVRMLHGVLGML